MKTRALLLVLSCAAGLSIAAPLRAQSLYFLEGDDRPVAPANVTPTSSFRIPPTQTGARGFFHWDLREWADCKVPYAITQDATADASTDPISARIALQNAFATWEAVSPALIGYARQNNSGTATAGLDNENLMLWDGGNAANLLALGGPGSGTLAVTFIFYDARCRIRESDILFNDRDYQWKNGNNSFGLYLPGSATPTFALADGQTLTLKIDGGAEQTITFNTADFADITAATQVEVVAAINAQLAGGSSAQLVSGAIGIRSSRTTYDGGTTVEITGGTGNGALGFPVGVFYPRGVDVESVSLHEIGHFNGIHHSSNTPNEPNQRLSRAVMYYASPDGSTRRALWPTDEQALNFLYTPDLGDAPDGALAALSGSYQTHVHTGIAQAGAAGMLNGVQRYQPADGPVHLFGFRGPSLPPAPASPGNPGRPGMDLRAGRFEWLGDDMDDSELECEARLTNADALDDGVTLPVKLTKGKKTRITIRVNTTNEAGRYALNQTQRLNLNGYIDFNLDSKFTTPTDLQLWWAGIPAATVAAGTMTQSNLVPALSDLSVNPMVLVFDVPVPANAPDNTWARFRLDYGEDEGRNAALPPGGWEGNLAPATGEAQFGEVEDMPVEATSQRLVFRCAADTMANAGEVITRTFCVGNAGAILDEFCYKVSDTKSWIIGSDQPLEGQSLLPPDNDLCVAVQLELPEDCAGTPDTLIYVVYPCDDPAAADTCYSVVNCAGATATLLSQFEGSTGTDFVELDYWLAEDGDLAGVHVLRADGETGDFRRLTTAPIPLDGRGHYRFTDRDVTAGAIYRYQLALVGRDGGERRAGLLSLHTQRAEFALGLPGPNPTSAGFRVSLALPRAGEASLRLVDVSGRSVRSLFRGNLAAGEHSVAWDGRRDDGTDAANGIYYLIYEAAGRRATHTVIVMR